MGSLSIFDSAEFCSYTPVSSGAGGGVHATGLIGVGQNSKYPTTRTTMTRSDRRMVRFIVRRARPRPGFRAPPPICECRVRPLVPASAKPLREFSADVPESWACRQHCRNLPGKNRQIGSAHV